MSSFLIKYLWRQGQHIGKVKYGVGLKISAFKDGWIFKIHKLYGALRVLYGNRYLYNSNGETFNQFVWYKYDTNTQIL